RHEKADCPSEAFGYFPRRSRIDFPCAQVIDLASIDMHDVPRFVLKEFLSTNVVIAMIDHDHPLRPRRVLNGLQQEALRCCCYLNENMIRNLRANVPDQAENCAWLRSLTSSNPGRICV